MYQFFISDKIQFLTCCQSEFLKSLLSFKYSYKFFKNCFLFSSKFFSSTFSIKPPKAFEIYKLFSISLGNPLSIPEFRFSHPLKKIPLKFPSKTFIHSTSDKLGSLIF
ncbi:hypothetical protein Ob7_07230 [Thermosipho africanus Ob7]|nr:hypothetical protein Ob7_07230 [Thermosipho africanus Ob7]